MSTQYEDRVINEGKREFFRTVFRRGKVDIQPFQEMKPKTVISFKKLKLPFLVFLVLLLTGTVLLMVKKFAEKEKLQVITSQELKAQHSDPQYPPELESDPQLIADISEEEVSLSSKPLTKATQATTVSTTTTMGTTPTTVTIHGSSTTEKTVHSTTLAPKVLNHIMATVVINRATVPNTDGITDNTDAYVKVFVDHTFIGQTPFEKNTLDPIWNYRIPEKWPIKPDSELSFELHDHDRYTSHDFIGRATQKISQLITSQLNGKEVKVDHGSGSLWFTVNWDEVYNS